MKISKERKEECKKHLKSMLRKGSTVYTVVRHRSASGMYRAIDLYVIKHNEPYRISAWAADLLEGYDQKHEACRASGCGMDMGFHLVNNLSIILFCPNGYTHDGAYALKQSWL